MKGTTTQSSCSRFLRCSTSTLSTQRVGPIYWLLCAAGSIRGRQAPVEVAHHGQQTAARRVASLVQRRAAEGSEQLASLRDCRRGMPWACPA